MTGSSRLTSHVLSCVSLAGSQLGTYDPIASAKDGVKEVRVKIDRVKYWLAVGAQPSEAVARLLGHVGLLPPPPIRFQPKKSQPRKAAKTFSTLASGASSSSSGSSSGGLVATVLGAPAMTLRPAFMARSPLMASLGFAC